MELAPLPSARHGFGGVVIGDTAYFPAGWTGGKFCPDNPTDELWAFNLK